MKTLEERRTYKREWAAKDRAANREKRLEASRRNVDQRKRWAAADRLRDPEKHRRKNRRQNGVPEPTRPRPERCELCGERPNECGNGATLHVDHCHTTGVFRGWLCRRCNVALGLLRDSADLCISAANYLNTAGLL